jgi:hypothetical protein
MTFVFALACALCRWQSWLPILTLPPARWSRKATNEDAGGAGVGRHGINQFHESRRLLDIMKASVVEVETLDALRSERIKLRTH